jgi:hypothetical protein
MARRSGTLGLSDLGEDFIANDVGNQEGEAQSVADVDVSVSIGDVADTASPGTLASKEISRYDYMTPNGMLRIVKVKLVTGEETWVFKMWDNPVTTKIAAEFIIQNGLENALPEEVLPYLPELKR